MNNNSISTIVEQQTITSMEIAEFTGLKHGYVLRVIRKLESQWERSKGHKFQILERRIKSGVSGYRTTPYYLLTKTEAIYVSTGFKYETYVKLRRHLEEYLL